MGRPTGVTIIAVPIIVGEVMILVAGVNNISPPTLPMAAPDKTLHTAFH